MVTGIPPPFPSGFTISTYGLTAWHAVHTAYAVHLCTEKEAKGTQTHKWSHTRTVPSPIKLYRTSELLLRRLKVKINSSVLQKLLLQKTDSLSFLQVETNAHTHTLPDSTQRKSALWFCCFLSLSSWRRPDAAELAQPESECQGEWSATWHVHGRASWGEGKWGLCVCIYTCMCELRGGWWRGGFAS